MTRADARELAVHLIYGREFTGEEPNEVVATRLDRDYYAKLSAENEIYTERPSRKQLQYIDSVVTGVANRAEELNEEIQKYSIGWNVGRISRLTRAVLQLAMYEILFVEDVPDGVAVAEAVRLAKKYDGNDTGSFVNGILGSFVRAKNAPQPVQAPAEAAEEMTEDVQKEAAAQSEAVPAAEPAANEEVSCM